MKEQKPEIKELSFEYREVEVVETFIDDSGKIRERTNLVSFPTGVVSRQDDGEEGGATLGD